MEEGKAERTIRTKRRVFSQLMVGIRAPQEEGGAPFDCCSGTVLRFSFPFPYSQKLTVYDRIIAVVTHLEHMD